MEKKRVREAEQAWKEAGNVYGAARDQVQAVLDAAEAEALRKYNEDTAPFLKTYRIAVSTAFRKAQEDSIKIGVTLGDREIEAYKELFRAREALREEAAFEVLEEKEQLING